MNKDRILLHSLLEKVFGMDCRNFSKKGSCFLVRRKGRKPKKKRQRDKRHRALPFMKTIFLQITEEHPNYKGLVSAIFISLKGISLSRLENRGGDKGVRKNFEEILNKNTM